MRLDQKERKDYEDRKGKEVLTRKKGGGGQGFSIYLEDIQDIKRMKEMTEVNRLWSSSYQYSTGKI